MINKNNSFALNIPFHFPYGKGYLFAIISIFVFLLTIYSNSFDCGWHFDDFPRIVNNRNVHLKTLNWKNIKKTFYRETVEKQKFYRPIAGLSLGLNYYFGGIDVFGYHLVNFIIHLLASIFLFLFIYDTLKLPLLKGRYEKISYPLALLATLFWATNPVQETSVTYIVQRMTSMAGMFSIMAMCFYLKGRTSQNWRQSISFFVLFAFSAIFAFGSKENSAMLPVSIFFYDLFLLQGFTKKNIRKSIRIIIIPLLLLSILVAKYMDFPSLFAEYAARPYTMPERLLTESRVIIYYIGLLLHPAPTRLTLLHDIQISRGLFDPWTTMAAIVAIILIIVFAFIFSRKRPFISFCIIFFLLNHLIESSFLPLELIYEHRNYLPSMLIFVPLAIFFLKVIDYFSYKKSLQFMMVFGITFLLASNGHTTFTRNEVFKNDFLLWKDNIDKSPRLSRAHNNLGKFYWEIGRNEKAFQEFNKAFQLARYVNLGQPSIVLFNMGLYYGKDKKDYDRALINYQEALKIYPGLTGASVMASKIMLRQGRIDEALKMMDQALSYWPNNAIIHDNLGLIFLKKGKLDEAISTAEKALNLNPNLIQPIGTMAEAFRLKGVYFRAIQLWEELAKKVPLSFEGKLALIELYSITGKKRLLNNTVSQFMVLKGDRSFEDIRTKTKKNAVIKVYSPDFKILMPIIKEALLNQSQAIVIPGTD